LPGKGLLPAGDAGVRVVGQVGGDAVLLFPPYPATNTRHVRLVDREEALAGGGGLLTVERVVPQF